MKKAIGKYKNNNLYLTIDSYQNNNRIYIGIETKNGLYADITINLTNMLLPDNYIFVNNDISSDLRKFLEEKGIIGKTIETYQYNMGRYDMVNINFDLLKGYDKEGFNLYKKDKSCDIEL